METGEAGLAHVRFQYYEKEKVEKKSNCPNYYQVRQTLNLTLTPTLPIELGPEKNPTTIFSTKMSNPTHKTWPGQKKIRQFFFFS